MGDRIVAFVENSIGPRLLLASHLASLGYTVTVLTTMGALRAALKTDGLARLILDEAAGARRGRALLEGLARTVPRPRIAWLGLHPPASELRVEARFDKPLDYARIA